MNKKEMLKAKLQEMENLKAEIEKLRAEIKAEEVPTPTTKIDFNYSTFKSLYSREEGMEMLKGFNTKELKEIAKSLSIYLKGGKREEIAERITEVVIGGNLRRKVLGEDFNNK